MEAEISSSGNALSNQRVYGLPRLIAQGCAGRGQYVNGQLDFAFLGSARAFASAPVCWFGITHNGWTMGCQFRRNAP